MDNKRWHRVGAYMVETDDKGIVIRMYKITDKDTAYIRPVEKLTLNALRVRHTRGRRIPTKRR